MPNFDGVFVGAARLPGFDCAGLGAGDTAYVRSVGAPYRLQDRPGPGGPLNNVPALNLNGYFWVREAAPNPVWWSQAAWTVSQNPMLGNDENLSVLATADELYRRLYKAQLTTAKTFVLDGDVPDGDSFVFDFDGPRIANHDLLGVETVLQSMVVVTSATPTNMPGNLLNTITVAGFDFTPYVGRALRVSGTRYATVLGLVSGTTDTVELSPCYNFTGGVVGDLVAGDVFDVVKRTKGPLMLELRGTPSASFRVDNIAFSGDGFFHSQSTSFSSFFYRRCEWSTTQGGIFYGNTIAAAGIYRCSGGNGFEHNGSNMGTRVTAGAFLNLPGQGMLYTSPVINVVTDSVARGSSITAAERVPVFFKGNNACTDLRAGQAAVNLTGYQSGLYVHGSWYGGRNGAGIGLQGNLGTRVLFSGPLPTLDAGVPIQTPTGVAMPWAILHVDDTTDFGFVNGA